MRVFITGANGYIGGAVASALIKDGHEVRGLVRDRAKAEAVAAHGIEPVLGSLDDRALLIAEARAADAVVNAASSDHRGAVEALIEGLEGSNKPLLHTSGSSIVGDASGGESSDAIYGEDNLPEPTADKAPRVAINQLVLDAAKRGVRSAVLCNTMIYGHGAIPSAASVQLPRLLRQAQKSGVVRHVGPGRNIWSNVHIDDVVDVYRRALPNDAGRPFYLLETARQALGRDCARPSPSSLGLGAGAVLAGRCGNRAAWGRAESGVLARLQQPGAGQGRGRAAAGHPAAGRSPSGSRRNLRHDTSPCRHPMVASADPCR